MRGHLDLMASKKPVMDWVHYRIHQVSALPDVNGQKKNPFVNKESFLAWPFHSNAWGFSDLEHLFLTLCNESGVPFAGFCDALGSGVWAKQWKCFIMTLATNYFTVPIGFGIYLSFFLDILILLFQQERCSIITQLKKQVLKEKNQMHIRS